MSGWDITKEAIRTFRLDRIDGEITASKDEGAYEIPDAFDVFDSLDGEFFDKTATVRIRKGKAQLLRIAAATCNDLGDWDRITLNYSDSSQIVDLVLWHGEDALIEEPESLRNEIILRLQKIVVLND